MASIPPPRGRCRRASSRPWSRRATPGAAAARGIFLPAGRSDGSVLQEAAPSRPREEYQKRSIGGAPPGPFLSRVLGGLAQRGGAATPAASHPSRPRCREPSRDRRTRRRLKIKKTRRAFLWHGEYYLLDTFHAPAAAAGTTTLFLETPGRSDDDAAAPFPPFLRPLEDVTTRKWFSSKAHDSYQRTIMMAETTADSGGAPGGG